jgi:superfamily II DNA or RNA helicase
VSRLRAFQAKAKADCYAAWQSGAIVVMPVLPTASGKTVIMGDIAHEYPGDGCAIAHRSELVGQIAVALAREGVRHDIIAPKGIIKTIVGAQMDELGRSFYDPRAKWKVASVDTILRRELDPTWVKRVGLVFQDEGHHVLRDNKWGRALSLFPHARVLLPTATPERADGKGLGRHADGLVDTMVIGPGMRWLIDNAYMTDYIIRAPSTKDLDMVGVDISAATGDYVADAMRARVKKSTTIIGDVVGTYLRYAKGQRGVTFAVDVEHATWIAQAFRDAGVPAQVVHAETSEQDRRNYMRAFKAGELLQLVNVDLFGEGVDVPAIQCVSMARPTASYGLYVQQFGRALRLMIHRDLAANWDAYTPAQRLAHIAQSEKPVAMIFDHVGNVITHGGPPDLRSKPWSLDARVKRSRAVDGIPLRACANETCLQPFERIYPACPYCGWEPAPPAAPTRPEHVDGDIVLYTREMLQELFGQKEKVDGPCYVPVHLVGTPAGYAIRNKHAARQEAQAELRAAMQIVLPPTLDERVANRRFFHTYGVDTISAQGLGSPEAQELRQRILDKVRGT